MICLDYSSDPFLRLMKNAPAAPAITTTPMIVKRYVPIPPVDGSSPSLVSLTGALTSVGTTPAPSVVSVTFVEVVVLVAATYAGC